MKLRVVYSTLLILLASCTSELPVAPDTQSQEQGVPVRFTFTVETAEDELSRAPILQEYLEDGAQIGIYALKGKMVNDQFTLTGNTNTGQTWHSDNVQTNFKNACYSAQTITDYKENEIHQLVATGTPGSFPAGSDAALRFYAYYPYTGEVTYTGTTDAEGRYPAAPKIPIYIEDNIEDTPDYLYTGAIDAKPTDASVNIAFKHALARLNVYIKTSNTSYNPRTCPTVTKIEVSALYSQEGMMNVETGNITAGEKERWDFSAELNYSLYAAKEATPIYTNLFIPNIEQGNYAAFFYYITVTVKDTSKNIKTFTFDYEDLSNIVLEKGKITNLIINYDI